MPGREFLSSTKPTRNYSAKRRQSYCRIKKKPHTDKIIFTFYSTEYILKYYSLIRQYFYMMYSSYYRELLWSNLVM